MSIICVGYNWCGGLEFFSVMFLPFLLADINYELGKFSIFLFFFYPISLFIVGKYANKLEHIKFPFKGYFIIFCFCGNGLFAYLIRRFVEQFALSIVFVYH